MGRRAEGKTCDTDPEDVRDQLRTAMAPLHLRGMWELSSKIGAATPAPVTGAWRWRAADILPLAHMVAEADVVAEERGSLLLANPSLSPSPFTTTTIQGAVRSLRGHTSVPSYRRSPASVRFILSGRKSYTTTDGTHSMVAPGDLILTPNWCTREHTNPTDEPVLWFDGLDFPIVTRLESASFDGQVVHVVPRSASSLLMHPWSVTDAELTDLFDDDPTEMASFQFTDPITGGVICLTFDCWMHRVGPELSAAPRRKTGSSIVVVLNGSGSSTIGDDDYDWEAGDIFVVPSWAPVQHHPSEVSNLFEMTDRPVMEALGLYREETLDS